jgi:hypothetical protein
MVMGLMVMVLAGVMTGVAVVAGGAPVTSTDQVPIWVWQGVGGIVGVLAIFGLLVFIVQRFVLLTRKNNGDEGASTGR